MHILERVDGVFVSIWHHIMRRLIACTGCSNFGLARMASFLCAVGIGCGIFIDFSYHTPFNWALRSLGGVVIVLLIFAIQKWIDDFEADVRRSDGETLLLDPQQWFYIRFTRLAVTVMSICLPVMAMQGGHPGQVFIYLPSWPLVAAMYFMTDINGGGKKPWERAKERWQKLRQRLRRHSLPQTQPNSG